MDWLNFSTLIDAVLGQSDNQFLNILLPIGAKVLGAAVVLVVGWIFAAWFTRMIDKFLQAPRVSVLMRFSTPFTMSTMSVSNEKSGAPSTWGGALASNAFMS